MKLTRLTLATTTALGLSMAMAHADSNELYIEQIGNDNISDVSQNNGDNLGHNRIGTQADPVTQKGDNNEFYYKDGNDNLSTRGHNVIDKAEQIGNTNKMAFQGGPVAKYNTVEDARQIGNNNILRFNVRGSRNTTENIRQDGNTNDIWIKQTGDKGTIENVRITGYNNGLGAGHNTSTANWGIWIDQRNGGNKNTVQNATIDGSNNTGWSATTFSNNKIALKIEQSGYRNTANAEMRGRNGNAILIDQNGTGNGGNTADVQQGVNTASTGNEAKLVQDGAYNDGTINQFGNYNVVTASQLGDGNSLSATFTGNYNGVGTMTGAANGLLTDINSPVSLAQGEMFQDSRGEIRGNSIDYNVTGSSNLFAFAQIGGKNTINGTVTTSNNQAAVLQQGWNNNSTFTQQGGVNNNLAVTQ